MSWISWPAEALWELLYPHHCLLCGQMDGIVPFFPRGRADQGLRPWDCPHLCLGCYDLFVTDPPIIMDAALLYGATIRTSPDLVELVGQWKYQGIRGMGWPLASMLVPVVECLQGFESVDVLLPIPLHSSRQRGRGFNQAGMLARLAGLSLGIPVASDLLVRHRKTGQQARLRGAVLRQENIQGAFILSEGSACGPLRIGLIDDLVTTGATAVAAAETLCKGGFRVPWVASLGIASQISSEE